MKIILRRVVRDKDYTVGILVVDGKHFGYTCEDEVRAVGEKIANQTAIPAGTYAIKMTMSQRFGKVAPILLDVPLFTGIRIHSGNSPADTSGCILVGYNVNGIGPSTISYSEAACTALYGLITDAIKRKEDVSISISNEFFPE